jgi:hypothetical protein
MTNDTTITSSFPTKVLTPFNTIPCYKTIRLLQTELNGNAASIHSYGGDGTRGHLALTLTPAAYNALSAAPFIPPAAPPLHPVHADNATQFQIAETNRVHDQNQITFRTYTSTDQILRNMLLTAVPAVYLRALRDDELLFGTCTTLQLLTHLWTLYGKITPAELDQNAVNMRLPWSPPTPIQTLFAQLEDGISYAAAGNEILSEPTVLRLGYNLILDNGLFDLPCRDWRNKDATFIKSMASFQLHFLRADEDRRITTTSGASGYANQVHRNNNNNNNNNPNGNTARPPPPTNTARPADNRPAIHYCWSHGFLKSPRHTSATCSNRSEGHQANATATNKMGGSTATFVAFTPAA